MNMYVIFDSRDYLDRVFCEVWEVEVSSQEMSERHGVMGFLVKRVFHFSKYDDIVSNLILGAPLYDPTADKSLYKLQTREEILVEFESWKNKQIEKKEENIKWQLDQIERAKNTIEYAKQSIVILQLQKLDI